MHVHSSHSRNKLTNKQQLTIHDICFVVNETRGGECEREGERETVEAISVQDLHFFMRENPLGLLYAHKPNRPNYA